MKTKPRLNRKIQEANTGFVNSVTLEKKRGKGGPWMVAGLPVPGQLGRT